MSAKLAEKMEIGNASSTTPKREMRPPTTRPKAVDGTMSPYPTAVMVMMHHQHACRMLWKAEGAPPGPTYMLRAPSHVPRSM